jgi:hypothetical protein
MSNVNLGDFLNEFAAKLFWPMAVAALFLLPIFGHFYNKLMDRLDGSDEHASIYVGLGNLVTIAVAALFSWKAGLLMLILFLADGLPMIFGEFKRTHKRVEAKKTPRRKRLPYAANGRIDDATMDVKEAMRLTGKAMKENDATVRVLQLAEATHELSAAHEKLIELKLIQQIEE